MKLMHTTTTKLNTREFNKLSDKIIDSLFALNPEIQDIYDIHINYIDDSWQIDFIPFNSNIPVIKVNTYTDYDSKNREILKISPEDLTDLPSEVKFRDENKSYDTCMDYVNIFEFIMSLYDFEYVIGD